MEEKSIIEQLSAAGVHIYLENGKLKTRSSKGVITNEIGELIRSNRDHIVAILEASESSQKVQAGEKINRIEKANQRDKLLPTSFSQQRLWFIDQMDGKSTHYNMPGVLDINGPFDVEIAEKAFATIVERHQILRTNFSSSES